MDLYTAKRSHKINVKPYLMLRISMKILRWTGTWAPPQNGIFRYLLFVQTFCIFIFKLGIFFLVEIVDIIINWGDLNKLASGVPVLLTNIAYAHKVD